LLLDGLGKVGHGVCIEDKATASDVHADWRPKV
jgi:hypothetical protein